jgi:hypothetical protein
MRTNLLTRASSLIALRLLVAASAALGLAGCPLQTPTFEAVSAGTLAITASLAAPLVGQTITLTAKADGVALPNARWTVDDPSILSLSSTSGGTITAVAGKAGDTKVSAIAGSLHGTVTITVLSSVGNVELLGPTSLALGKEATYTASVTDATGRPVIATVTWAANGSVAFATPGGNTGASMRITARSVGPGAVTAQAGGRAAQIAVNVTASNGQLVITRPDGSALPPSLPLGSAVTVQAAYAATGQAANDAQWTAAGACTLVGSSGATISVQEMAAGTCTLTASAGGMKATAMFTIVDITDIKITGDTTQMVIGETRTLTAVGIAGGVETGPLTVVWSAPGQVLDLAPAGSTVKVTGVEVGTGTVVAMLPGKGMASADLTVAPSMIDLSAPGTRLLPGSAVTATVKAIGPTGLPGRFSSAASVTLAGASGFTTVGAGVLQGDGSVTFALGGAAMDSPSVTATWGAVVSNKLSFTIAHVVSVAIGGPQGPVRVGSTVDLTAMAKDAAGQRIDGDLLVTWTDANGVYTFPMSTSLNVTATVAKLGTSSIVATVMGVASPPFASPAQPASVGLTMFTPASIAVGGTATAVVTVLDSAGVPIPGVTLAQVKIASDDATKVSFDAGALVNMGMGFQFTATGLAATAAAGVNVTATWTDGMFPVDSGAVPLVVSGP